MCHDAYIGFVDAHSKGIRSHHDAHAVVLPVALALVLLRMFQSGMIEGGSDASLIDEVSEFLAAPTTACIHNGRTLHAAENVYQFFALVGSIAYYISQVFAFETHAEHMRFLFRLIGWRESKLLLDILHHLRCGCGSECQHRHTRQQLPDFGYLKIRRTEVVAPLRNAVRLVDGEQRNIQVLLHPRNFSLQTLRRDV